jgi:hypothetical protein
MNNVNLAMGAECEKEEEEKEDAEKHAHLAKEVEC